MDAENRGRVQTKFLALIATRDEFEMAGRFNARDVADYADLVFSAKEAFYKAQYPLTGLWLGFHDVTLVGFGKTRFGLRLEKDVRKLEKLLERVIRECLRKS